MQGNNKSNSIYFTARGLKKPICINHNSHKFNIKTQDNIK